MYECVFEFLNSDLSCKGLRVIERLVKRYISTVHIKGSKMFINVYNAYKKTHCIHCKLYSDEVKTIKCHLLYLTNLWNKIKVLQNLMS